MSDLGTIPEVVDALTNPIRVREPIYRWDDNRNKKITRYHQHTLPSLLAQLAKAVVPGEVYIEDDGGHVHRKPRSIPPARLEAIQAIIQIEAGAALWMLRSGLSLRQSAERNLRALVGARLDSDASTALLADLRRWYGWAATLTGWERPAWRPRVPCPACEQFGLRVNLTRQTAACVECGATWDPSTIGILGAYVTGLATVGS